MWQTMLKRDVDLSTYLEDFSNLLKAQMTLQQGLESNALKENAFQNVREDLDSILQAVRDTDFGDTQLTGETTIEQLEDLMDTLVVNISREESLRELEAPIKKVKEEFENWLKNKKAGMAKLGRGDRLQMPFFNRTSGRWQTRSVNLPFLPFAKQTIVLLTSLKKAFENPIVNVDNELEYSSVVYEAVDELGKGIKFNQFIKPIYQMSPRKGPLATKFQSMMSGSGGDISTAGQNITNIQRQVIDYEEKLHLAEQQILDLLKSNVANTDEDLYERIQSMIKRREVDDAFKLRTQAVFDNIFGGQTDMSEVEDRVIDERISSALQGATLTNDDFLAMRSE